MKFQNAANTLNFRYFIEWAILEKGEWPLFSFLNDNKSSLLKSQDSLYLEFIPKYGLFHKCYYCRLWNFKLAGVNLTAEGTLLMIKFGCHVRTLQANIFIYEIKLTARA